MTALLRLEGVACIRGGRLLFEGLDLALGAGEALVLTGAQRRREIEPDADRGGAASRLGGKGRAGIGRRAGGRDGGFGRAADAGARARLLGGLDGVCAEAGMEPMGLSRLARVPVRMLSTGQRKRAVLARVVASGSAALAARRARQRA
jgi:heme exporter protein A